MTKRSRRKLLAGAAAFGACMTMDKHIAFSAVPERRFELTSPLEGWDIVSGTWTIEEVTGAAGGRALVQHATGNDFNVILAPSGPYTDVAVTVRFKPISGREDASGGIVFRFADGHYYVMRANALEDNFNLYYYDRGRRQLAGSTVKAPALGQWHTLRITAERDRLRGWLNGEALMDWRDGRYEKGRIGLWTKANSITAFDELIVTPLGDS